MNLLFNYWPYFIVVLLAIIAVHLAIIVVKLFTKLIAAGELGVR